MQVSISSDIAFQERSSSLRNSYELYSQTMGLKLFRLEHQSLTVLIFCVGSVAVGAQLQDLEGSDVEDLDYAAGKRKFLLTKLVQSRLMLEFLLILIFNNN